MHTYAHVNAHTHTQVVFSFALNNKIISMHVCAHQLPNDMYGGRTDTLSLDGRFGALMIEIALVLGPNLLTPRGLDDPQFLDKKVPK